MSDAAVELQSPSAEQWNSALQRCHAPSILQSFQWGEFKRSTGWGVIRHRSAAGVAQVLLRHTPLGRLAYVPRGPALSPELPFAVAAGQLIGELAQLARECGCIALKLEPPWPASPEVQALLQRLGFRPAFQAVQVPSTVLVDLRGEEEALLARMKPKTRYNIRLSLRKGVTVRIGGDVDLPAFAALMQQTARRDGFPSRDPAYYEGAYRAFAADGMAALLLGEHEGALLAAIMVFAFGDMAYYLYGASSDEKRNLMASYAVQWRAMVWARERGCETYDLWGIPEEVGAHPELYVDTDRLGEGGLWGVWRFKRGFGGKVVRYAGAWDLVQRPLPYALYRTFFWGRRLWKPARSAG